MDGFSVIVDFRLLPGTADEFVDLVARNADSSVRLEPGCRRFDVLVPGGSDDRVVLYEIYDDEAAFEAHMATPHFAAFDAASIDLVTSKSVETFDLREAAAG